MRLNEVKGDDDVICLEVLLAAILNEGRGEDNSLLVILLALFTFNKTFILFLTTLIIVTVPRVASQHTQH